MEFVFFKFEKCLFFDGVKVLLLNLLNLLFIVFMQVSHFLDVLSNGHFFGVNSVLMRLVEIPLLPELLPGRNGLLSTLIGDLELDLELVNLLFKFDVFVLAVSYQSDADVVEGALLLQLVPLRVEDVERLGHFVLGQEVPDEEKDDIKSYIFSFEI